MPLKVLEAKEKGIPVTEGVSETPEKDPGAETGTTTPTVSQEGETSPAPSAESGEPPTEPSGSPKKYFASIYPERALPPKFVDFVKALEANLQMPVFMIIQGDESEYSSIEEPLVEALHLNINRLPVNKPVALIIDSPGGSAKSAFKIAEIFRRHCGGFHAVIPRYAKSAATLLVLGAEKIILGSYAELGPLDAQILDKEREEYISALDEVQALERLLAFALVALDRSMLFMLGRAGKKIDTLLPHMLNFVNGMTCPLFEKIDAVHYTQMSRALKLAEEYAVRLLQPKYSSAEARYIAQHLVEKYSDHGFFIGADEVATFGLKTEAPVADQRDIIDSMIPFVGRLTVIGMLKKEGEQ